MMMNFCFTFKALTGLAKPVFPSFFSGRGFILRCPMEVFL